MSTTVKDNTTNPGKAFYDQHYRTCVGMIVEVATSEGKLLGEVTKVVATRGCLGKVTFTVKQVSGQETEVSWRDANFKNIRQVGIDELFVRFLKVGAPV